MNELVQQIVRRLCTKGLLIEGSYILFLELTKECDDEGLLGLNLFGPSHLFDQEGIRLIILAFFSFQSGFQTILEDKHQMLNVANEMKFYLSPESLSTSVAGQRKRTMLYYQRMGEEEKTKEQKHQQVLLKSAIPSSTLNIDNSHLKELIKGCNVDKWLILKPYLPNCWDEYVINRLPTITGAYDESDNGDGHEYREESFERSFISLLGIGSDQAIKEAQIINELSSLAGVPKVIVSGVM